MSERSSGTWSSLRHRNFALLWLGQSVSLTGDGIFSVALAIVALDVDRSPAGLSYVLAARLIPTVVFLLLGGAVADRVSRRLIMLASDLARGLVVGVVTVLLALGRLTIAELVVMSLLFGVADAAFSPASTAILPEIVPEGLLVNANALRSTSQTVAMSLLGPALGGVVVGVIGSAWAFGLDALTFVISAGFLLAMRPGPGGPRSSASAFAHVREGMAFAARNRWFWVTLIAAALANFAAFSPLALLIPLLVRVTLHGSASALGLVFAAGGLGGVVGSMLLARLGSPRRQVVAMCLAWGFSGVAIAGIAGAANPVMAGVFEFAVIGLLVYGNTLWYPLLQRLVPPGLLGQVSSIDAMVSIALSPLGLLAAGVVSAAIGVRATLFAGAVISATTPLYLLVPRVRDPDRRAEGSDSAEFAGG